MTAVTWLHSILGPALAGALVVLALSALATLRGALPGWLDTSRRVVLGLLVAEAALGLALALRGSAPAEPIHWVYGAAAIVVLLLAGALVERDGMPSRGAALVVASGVGALLAWRLWGTG